MNPSRDLIVGAVALVSSLVAGSGCDGPTGSRASADQDITVGGGAATLEPNDVSILWPVAPDRKPSAGYLKLFPAEGERGPAFPTEAFDDGTFPPLVDVNRDAIRAALTIVGMRVVPCDTSHLAGECVHQLRLIAQPMIGFKVAGVDTVGDAIMVDAQPQTSTAGGIHVIYRLTEQELDELVGKLVDWAERSPVPTGGRLSVHPGLKHAGVDSQFARELSDIVLTYATEASLVKVTFSTFSGGNKWFFSQFSREGTAWKSQPIPGLSGAERSQLWEWHGSEAGPGTPDVTATPPLKLDFSSLGIIAALPAPVDHPSTLAARDAILAYENPRSTNAETVDCVGCHLAANTRTTAEFHGVSFDAPSAYVPPSWMDATVDGFTSPENVIAFGYRANPFTGAPETIVEPSINRRVVFDTAEALIQLRARRR